MGKLMLRVLGSFLGTVGVYGCADECDSAGCIDGLSVQFKEPVDAGSRIEIMVRQDEGATDCVVDRAAGLDECTEQGVWIQYDGESVRGFILEAQHPEELDVTIVVEGAEVVSKTVTPEYVAEQPNGSDCSPRCLAATVVI